MAIAVEADLADAEVITRLFDVAEDVFGPVDILVNNATGWVADTFTARSSDDLGRNLQRVSAGTFDQRFSVDARATSLLVSEFADRHHGFGLSWGRIIGLTSGGSLGFPSEVSYGTAKAAPENYSMAAAFELADRGITSNVVYPPGDRHGLGHPRSTRGGQGQRETVPYRTARGSCRGDRISRIRCSGPDHRQYHQSVLTPPLSEQHPWMQGARRAQASDMTQIQYEWRGELPGEPGIGVWA